MTILTSSRLRYEPIDDRHFDGMQAMNRDPEVMRYILGRPETPDETRAMIARVYPSGSSFLTTRGHAVRNRSSPSCTRSAASCALPVST